MSHQRAIPPRFSAVIQQALLNLYLASSDENLLGAREVALAHADAINAEYDKWLHKERSGAALPEAATAALGRKEADGDGRVRRRIGAPSAQA